jgi:hypothetical protein
MRFIANDDLDRFEELLKKIKGVDFTKNPTLTGLKRIKKSPSTEAVTTLYKVDEFLLLSEIVKRERVHFLQLIADKGLFPVT